MTPIGDRPHVVYRVFDANDNLLYVGCTSAIKKRVHQHRCHSAWWVLADHVRVSRKMRRPLAYATEGHVIHAERPQYNADYPEGRSAEAVYFTPREVAAMWKVPADLVRGYAVSGELRSHRIDGFVRFLEPDLDAFIEARTVPVVAA